MKVFHDEKTQRITVLDERFYTQDNKTFFPSVTTVLDAYPKGPFLKEWLMSNGFNAKTLLKQAGERGTSVHNAIEAIRKGQDINWINEHGKENYKLDEWQMICKYMEFHRRYVTEIESSEQMLFSKKMKLGGTLDAVDHMYQERWLIDYKTSNSIYQTHKIQMAVYKEMYEEQTKNKVDRYGILWLNSSHRAEKDFQGVGWKLIELTTEHEHNLKLYKHTRAIWDQENPNYKPKNLIYPGLLSLEETKQELDHEETTQEKPPKAQVDLEESIKEVESSKELGSAQAVTKELDTVLESQEIQAPEPNIFKKKLEEIKDQDPQILQKPDGLRATIVAFANGSHSQRKANRPGAYSYFLSNGVKSSLRKSIAYEKTNLNRMHLKGIIATLESIKTVSDITIYSNSKYVVDWATDWADKWAEKAGVINKYANAGLWHRFASIYQRHRAAGSAIAFKWVNAINDYEEFDWVVDESGIAWKEAEEFVECKADN